MVNAANDGSDQAIMTLEQLRRLMHASATSHEGIVIELYASRHFYCSVSKRFVVGLIDSSRQKQ